MNGTVPRLSIGLPVFNGENYLEEALESLLRQTYEDFELIISDNASTDRTREICRKYAATDQRIRYYRNEKNIGSAQNFYRAFELSSTEYFKWAAHDDLHAPEFLEQCIQVLDQDASVVLCYPRTKFIDEEGKVIRNFDVGIDTSSSEPHKRLYNMISVDYWTLQMFGVMRAKTLRASQFYMSYYGWDWNMLAEICLRGRVYELPDYLFFRRQHPGTSSNLYFKKQQQLGIYDPTITWKTPLLGLRKFRGYFTAVTRAPLSPSERFMCYGVLARLMVEKSANRLKRHWKSVAKPSPAS